MKQFLECLLLLISVEVWYFAPSRNSHVAARKFPFPPICAPNSSIPLCYNFTFTSYLPTRLPQHYLVCHKVVIYIYDFVLMFSKWNILYWRWKIVCKPKIIIFQYALHVYENLVSVGKKYNMLHAGYYAMRSLRIEKFYAFWGQDLDSTTTPLECGRGFRVKLQVSVTILFLTYLVLMSLLTSKWSPDINVVSISL